MLHIGFDSRMFTRNVIKKDKTEGFFESVLGAGIRADDIDDFDKHYSKAIEIALKDSGIEGDYKYYCTHDIPEAKREVFLESFFKQIQCKIECAHIFYTLFSESQLRNIKVYGRKSKRLGLKFAKPTRTRIELLAEHISQCFPAICAWRICGFFSTHNTHFHFDFYQGHICEAQEEIERFNCTIYPNGDCANPLISTADLLLALLDTRLRRQNKFLLFENIRPTLPELGDRVKVYPILNQHLPKITPLDDIPINANRLIKHPVFWIFKNDPLITNEFIKGSKAYRNLVDFAAAQGGVVKMFDKKNDLTNLYDSDYGVYFDSSGRETIESYKKFGKPLKPMKIDIMVPQEAKKV